MTDLNTSYLSLSDLEVRIDYTSNLASSEKRILTESTEQIITSDHDSSYTDIIKEHVNSCVYLQFIIFYLRDFVADL